MNIDLKKGDIILGGRFKNKKIEVKEFGRDELGQYTVNGRKLLSYRIEKLMPKKNRFKKTADLNSDLAVNQPSYIARQMGASRARTTDNGVSASPELIKTRFKEGAPSAGIGAGIGGLLGLLAASLTTRSGRETAALTALAAAAGGITGFSIGSDRGSKKHLAERGILEGNIISGPAFTNKAIKRYITERRHG